MLSHCPAPGADQFPAIGRWVVERGRIAVGRNQDAGFVVRAMHDSGPVFEDDRSSTLGEALAALEKGLAKLFSNQETAGRSSSPTVEKTKRRPLH